MQLHSELDLEASRIEASSSSPRKRNSVARRKVTIRLAENIHAQLEAATERPGVGKSMVVAAALENFLNPHPSAEDPIRQRFDEMNARFDALERGLRIIAETVVLAVVPRLPHSEQQTGRRPGDERCNVPAEQIDGCGRPAEHLVQETIDPRNDSDREGFGPAIGEGPPRVRQPSHNSQRSASEGIDIGYASSAAAGEGGSNSYFHRRRNAFCRPA